MATLRKGDVDPDDVQLQSGEAATFLGLRDVSFHRLRKNGEIEPVGRVRGSSGYNLTFRMGDLKVLKARLDAKRALENTPQRQVVPLPPKPTEKHVAPTEEPISLKDAAAMLGVHMHEARQILAAWDCRLFFDEVMALEGARHQLRHVGKQLAQIGAALDVDAAHQLAKEENAMMTNGTTHSAVTTEKTMEAPKMEDDILSRHGTDIGGVRVFMRGDMAKMAGVSESHVAELVKRLKLRPVNKLGHMELYDGAQAMQLIAAADGRGPATTNRELLAAINTTNDLLREMLQVWRSK